MTHFDVLEFHSPKAMALETIGLQAPKITCQAARTMLVAVVVVPAQLLQVVLAAAAVQAVPVVAGDGRNPWNRGTLTGR